jgi:ankyrin repeat protein
MNRIPLPQNKGNELLMHCVAHLDTKNIVALLDDKEADVNCRNINGATPLHYAVHANSAAVIEILLKHGADPNLKEYIEMGEKAPLHYAIEKNAFECSKKLMEYGANTSV